MQTVAERNPSSKVEKPPVMWGKPAANDNPWTPGTLGPSLLIAATGWSTVKVEDESFPLFLPGGASGEVFLSIGHILLFVLLLKALQV